ncbi:MAG: porin family protein [Nitritalea sp.]
MKKVALVTLFCMLLGVVNAQESTQSEENTVKKTRERTPVGGRPDLKGDLFIDFGFNLLNNRPAELNTRFFASRTLNVSYQYPIPIFGERSGFSFNPGIGIGSDRMGLRADSTFVADPVLGPGSSAFASIRGLYGDDIQIRRNNFVANYLDIPLEFRYHFNKSDYSRSFKIAVGAKVGLLMNAHTKVAYTDPDGNRRQIKDRQSYGLNPIRYGVYTRIAFPGFNFWGYYGLNNIWKEGRGPLNTEANQINFGISVALF